MEDQYRILVIDDNKNIHDDFQKIFVKKDCDRELSALENDLFEDEAEEESLQGYRLSFAFQGEEGVKMIAEAYAAGDPYALAFIDMRMPPGWNGVETIRHIFEIDPSLQVVICTAYSDYSWEDIHKLISSNNVLILKKPFDVVEVQQLAFSLTEKWSLFHHLKKARKQAVNADQLKTEFLNVISHELKTPITIIQSNIELLQDQTDLPEPAEIAEIAVDIKESAVMLNKVVSNLLDYSGLEAGTIDLQYSQTSTGVFLDWIRKTYAELIQKKHLQLNVSGQETITLIGDCNRLKQMLGLLLENAIKYTTEGTITVAINPLDESVEFKIRDTGWGIPQSELTRIFAEFSQVENSLTRKKGGTGVGLALVKKIVDLHRGEIKVSSRVGEGSCFHVRIPFHP